MTDGGQFDGVGKGGANLLRRCSTWGINELMIRSCQGQVSFTNSFFSNLKTVNLKIFASHDGIYT